MEKGARAASAADVSTPHRVLARLSGARLCYGKPVEAGGRVVIPVASLRTLGGGGLGTGAQAGEIGWGAGGLLEARPVGFIEVGEGGARFEPINDGRLPAQTLAGAALALIALRQVSRRRRRAARLTRGGAASPALRLPRPARLRLPSPRR